MTHRALLTIGPLCLRVEPAAERAEMYSHALRDLLTSRTAY